MKVTTVTVGYRMTADLGDYENVRPEATMAAEVEKGDGPSEVAWNLMKRTRELVEEAIDQALEMKGRSPRFNWKGEPLFVTRQWEQARQVAIMPAGVDTQELPGTWGRATTEPVRLWAARQAGLEALPSAEGWELVEDVPWEPARLWEWWEAREWYRAYGMVEWLDPWRTRTAQLLVARSDVDVGLFLDRECGPLKLFAAFSRTLRGLDELVELLAREYPELDRLVVRSEEELDVAMAEWIADHPRPAEPQVPALEEMQEYDAEEPYPDDDVEEDEEWGGG